MRYLHVTELLIIHQALIEHFGGMAGITEAGFARLEAAAATPQLSAFGEELYPELADKAGALTHALISGHPFSDGNKRVAVVALDLLLTINGARLTATNDEVYDLAVAAAVSMSRGAVIDWVREHMTSLLEARGARREAREPQPSALGSQPGEARELQPAAPGVQPARAQRTTPEPAASTTHHLTLGDIVDLRDRFAVEDPWRFEIVNSAGLLSALSTPFQAAFGQESFPDLLDKAAALVFLLIANHPFRDGNKRVAAAALRLFLARNGLTLRATELELRALTRLVTSLHEPRDARLLDWLARHIEP